MPITLPEKISDLLNALTKMEKETLPETKVLQKNATTYRNAAMSFGDSWSQVPLGYLTNLYYENYQKSPKTAEIDPLAGGSITLDNGWKSRSVEDLVREINKRAGLALPPISARLEEITRIVTDFRTDVLVQLSVIRQMDGLESEKELLDKIEEFDLERNSDSAALLKHDLPLAIVSLDSKASAQGVKPPPHQQAAAYAYGIERQFAAIRGLADLAKRVLRQLAEHTWTTAPTNQGPLAIVTKICRRLSSAAQPLRNRRAGHQPFLFNDEYDVQDLLHALLKLHFDDVRPEEYTPSYGGKSTKMDFLLKEEQIVVEAKLTGDSLPEKKVLEQLAIDAAYYKQHPDCKTLVCLIFDPDHRIGNPYGLEKDVSRLSTADLQVLGIVSS